MKYLRKFNSVQEMQAAVLADKVSFLGLAQPQGQEPTVILHVHVPVLPSNLTISCSNNTVTISATNATTLEYKLSQSSEYTTYTQPFAITETVTVYAKATNADGSITTSQECEYVNPIDYTIPFYIEDIGGSANTVSIKKTDNSAPTLTIQKSTDGINWSSMGKTSTSGITATIPANGRLYLRCSTTSWCAYINYNPHYNSITTTGNCNVGGNINSLLYGLSFNGQTEFPNNDEYMFYELFKNTHVVNAENLLLPATTLANYCYSGMFSGCTSLTTAPELPATTLTSGCYSGMFQSCTSLTTAPALPATTLTIWCYSYMFYNCTHLNYIKCLATNKSATNCTSDWVSGVAANGTFVKNPNMSSWTTGASGIQSGWTVEDATE